MLQFRIVAPRVIISKLNRDEIIALYSIIYITYIFLPQGLYSCKKNNVMIVPTSNKVSAHLYLIPGPIFL